MDSRLLCLIVFTIFISFQYGAVARPSLTIVNGTTAEDGEFPYVVQLRDQSGYFSCGGAIIGPEWILTTGYCISDGETDSITYGTIKLHDHWDGYPNTSIDVKKWFVHPNLGKNNDIPIYDVGLLQLAKPILYSKNAQPIKLAEADETIPFHVEGVFSGWGYDKRGTEFMRYLQKLNLPLLTDEECSKKLSGYNKLHHICSDDHKNGLCTGDMGGPFVINDTVYGLVSWTYIPCGSHPGAYSRISNPEYRNWIKNVTGI